jgi:hypothetical protein
MVLEYYLDLEHLVSTANIPGLVELTFSSVLPFKMTIGPMIAVDDEWYDLEKWAKYHPGGTFIAVFGRVCFIGSNRHLT